MSHFQTRVKNFFAIRENSFSRRPFGRGRLVGANGFMRLFDPTVKHFSVKKFVDLRLADCLFNQHTEKTQKNVWIFLQAISFPRAQGLPIESGRNHRSACCQHSLLPAVFPTFPCDTKIPGHMALPYPFTRKIAAIQISFVFQCNARNSRREILALPCGPGNPFPLSNKSLRQL